MNEEKFSEYINTLDNVWLDFPFGEGVAVYKYGDKPEGKIIAIVKQGSDPLRVSLKCDPQLAIILRDRYETVLPGHHLNKNHWNTILCTGQIPEDEFFDLVRHSYELVRA